MPLPILNQPFQVVHWYPTANVICKCKEGVIVFLTITGFGNWVKCGHCGKLYSIEKLNTDGTCDVLVQMPGLETIQ